MTDRLDAIPSPFLARAFLVSADRGRFSSGVLVMVMDFAVRYGIVAANPMNELPRKR